MTNVSVSGRIGLLIFSTLTLIVLGSTARKAAASTIAITSPANGASVSGVVPVVAGVGSGVWWAKLYVDGNGSAVSPPYTFNWNSANVADGTHTLMVAAFARGATAPMATSTIEVVVANHTSGGTVHFSTLAPHSALPSASQCAALIASTPETIPSNTSYNGTGAIPTASQLAQVHSAPTYDSTIVPAADFASVNGNYAGSTDMIVRWAACKWGIDEDIARAQAWTESGWHQNDLGDWRTSIQYCQRGIWNAWNGSGCYQSYGIFQVKLASFNAYPEAINSTAFNADFRMAYQRACMNGDINYLASDSPTSGYPAYPKGSAQQMLWGCVGDWYSGDWYDSGALNYISEVQQNYSSKPWLP